MKGYFVIKLKGMRDKRDGKEVVVRTKMTGRGRGRGGRKNGERRRGGGEEGERKME